VERPLVLHLLEILGHFPTDDAFGQLVERLESKDVQAALLRAAARYPGRALRLLSAAASRGPGVAADLLRVHVRTNSSLVAAILPTLPPPVRERVESVTGSGAVPPVAPASLLPRVLVDPAWATARSPKPILAEVLVLTATPAPSCMVWHEGERAAWAATRGEIAVRSRDTSWDAWLTEKDWRDRTVGVAQFLVQAPEQPARPVLEQWRPSDGYLLGGWLPAIVARFELDALPLALHAAHMNAASYGPALLPFGSAEVAAVMLDWLARLKSGRALARAWLRRHPAVAAAALVPVALGPGTLRRTAQFALRTIVSHGHDATVRAAAATYGPAATALIESFLSIDPLDVVPERIPKLPDWASPANLPPVLLRDRAHALPGDSVAHLCTMLSVSTLDDVYLGLTDVRATCDPASLAEFVWALFVQWRAVGLPADQGWILDSLGILGDDEVVRGLVPAMRSWPGDGGFARAARAVEVLAAIGTDAALMHLHGIAERTTSSSLRGRIGVVLTEAASARGLSTDQLVDRLVPDLGLSPDGRTLLDYGPRRFVVDFDEQLRPRVSELGPTGPRGKHVKDLPKPGAKDSAALAQHSYDRYQALKKDARALAADLIRRLEQAMIWRRRWSGRDFRDVLVAHPVLRHLVRGIVWGVYDAAGHLVTALRVAEDHTFAGADDRAVGIDPAAHIGVVHPAELGDALAAWTGLLADYTTLQPFPQLGRETYHLTEAECASTRLSRFEGLTVPTKALLGLERRGWVQAEPEDGLRGWLYRPVSAARAVVVNLDPGITPRDVPEQRLQAIWVNDSPGGAWEPSGTLAFGELDPASISEILGDLADLKGSA
jgi:hypothetical protein